MTPKKIILFILVFPLLVSCEDYLREEPFSFLSEENFPANAEDGRIALNGAYSALTRQNILGYQDIVYGSADTDYASFGASLSNNYGLYQDFVRSSADVYPRDLWVDLFRGINACNKVIDVASEKQFSGADKLIAEAKALRAYFYLRATSLFGDVPFLTKSTNGPGSLNVGRTSVDEINAALILDLDEAQQVMKKYPAEFAVRHRGGLLTLGATTMIKAYVYLFMAGKRRSPEGTMVEGNPSYWTNVRDACQEIVNMGIYRLDPDYTNVFYDYYLDKYNAESIWEIDFSMPSNGSTFPNAMAAPPYGANSGGGFGNIRTTRAFYESFDTLDIRRDWTIGSGSFSGFDFVKSASPADRPYVNKFRKVPGNGNHGWNTPGNTPVYRYAEVLLLLAEAESEISNGPNITAFNAINEIRYRARHPEHKNDGTALPDLAGLDYAEFKNAIINERAFELAFEGKRRMDLIRWGLFMEKLQAFPDGFFGMSKAARVREYHMLMPIPMEEMNLNSGIWKQNNGW